MKPTTIWSQVTVERIAAAFLSMRDTESRAESVKGEWTEAKKTRDTREDDLLQALEAADERHGKGAWALDTTDALRKLQKDYTRSRDKFDVKDREKRRLEDQAGKLRTHVLKLVEDAATGDQMDLPMGKPAETDPEAWRQVLVMDLVGELQAEPFKGLGVTTLGDVLEAQKAKSFEQWKKEGDLTKEQLEHLGEAVATYLDRTDRAKLVPPEWKELVQAKVEKPKAPDDASDIPGAGGAGKRSRKGGKGEGAPEGPVEGIGKAMTEKDAAALARYQSTRTHEEVPPLTGPGGKQRLANVQSWPFLRWDVDPIAPGDPKVMIALPSGKLIMHVNDLADYLDTLDAGTPSALMVGLKQAVADAQQGEPSIPPSALAYCLDRMSQLQVHFGASPRYRDTLADIWNAGDKDSVRMLSPLTAALMEREAELSKGDGPEEKPAAEGTPAELTTSAKKKGGKKKPGRRAGAGAR